MQLDRLSAEDIRILDLEAGNIRGHVCKIVVLRPGDARPMPTLDELRAHVDARLDAVPRLRRRLLRSPLTAGSSLWIDDERFDIARHIRAVEEPGPVGPERLPEIVAELMAQRLDRDHPLWRIDVVEAMADGSIALVWRIHHCLADGTMAMRLAGELLWAPTPDVAVLPVSDWRPAMAPGSMWLLAHCAGAGFGPAGRRARSLVAEARGLPRTRRRARESRAAVRRDFARTANATPLDCIGGPARRVAFASAPLADCHSAGKAIDAAVTINDVVLAAVAGGMRAWLEQRGLPEQGIRVKVPVSLHAAAGGDRDANHDSYFVVDLPVGEAGIAERLLALNRETIERKRLHDAEAIYAATMRRSVARRAMSPRVFTLNVSNVPGPRNDVYVLGCRVCELYSVADIAQRHALRVAVISAAGMLSFGLCADRDAVDDVEVVAEGIGASLRDLVAGASSG
jgi:diacylglycerol O-acyltransferase